MGFEQLHPDPRVRRGHGRARDLRAAYLQDLVLRLMRPTIWQQRNGATTADATPHECFPTMRTAKNVGTDWIEGAAVHSFTR
jgi:hypothetical protein